MKQASPFESTFVPGVKEEEEEEEDYDFGCGRSITIHRR